MITRRCSERRFFMRPDREINNAFMCCLAFVARKARVSIVGTGTWCGAIALSYQR
jgi:inosine/xanthosine triphosphate pyrophosphatase family protein